LRRYVLPCYYVRMDIKEITSKKVWEDFLLKCGEKTFLDSWNWGEFQRKQEDKVFRFGVYKKDLIAVFSAVKIIAKRGVFLFVPHAPNSLENVDKKKLLEKITAELKELGKKEKAWFLRIAPVWSKETEKIFKDLGFNPSPIHIHPEVTWELDISDSEEKIISGMRKTTRYLVKQGEKNKDIDISMSCDLKDVESFYNLLKETAGRHKFVPFSLNYLIEQFSCFNPDGQIAVWLGKYKGEIISSAITVYWQGGAYYHHGASLQKYNSNKVPASYLLQWEAIKEAKRRNCSTYNFWGIAPEIKSKEDAEKSSHPWAGLSLFKMGFGGERKDYAKTQDFPLSPLYYLTSSFEKIRKSKRRL